MTSWPEHLPSGNQKRFWRDPGSGAGNGQRIEIDNNEIDAIEMQFLAIGEDPEKFSAFLSRVA